MRLRPPPAPPEAEEGAEAGGKEEGTQKEEAAHADQKETAHADLVLIRLEISPKAKEKLHVLYQSIAIAAQLLAEQVKTLQVAETVVLAPATSILAKQRKEREKQDKEGKGNAEGEGEAKAEGEVEGEKAEGEGGKPEAEGEGETAGGEGEEENKAGPEGEAGTAEEKNKVGEGEKQEGEDGEEKAEGDDPKADKAAEVTPAQLLFVYPPLTPSVPRYSHLAHTKKTLAVSLLQAKAKLEEKKKLAEEKKALALAKAEEAKAKAAEGGRGGTRIKASVRSYLSILPQRTYSQWRPRPSRYSARLRLSLSGVAVG